MGVAPLEIPILRHNYNSVLPQCALMFKGSSDRRFPMYAVSLQPGHSAWCVNGDGGDRIVLYTTHLFAPQGKLTPFVKWTRM